MSSAGARWASISGMKGEPSRSRKGLDQPVRNVRRQQDPVAITEVQALALHLEDRCTVEHHDPFVVGLVVVDGCREMPAQDVLDDGAIDPSNFLGVLAELGRFDTGPKVAPNQWRHVRRS